MKKVLSVILILLIMFSCNKTTKKEKDEKHLSIIQQKLNKAGFQIFEDKILAPDFTLTNLDNKQFKLSENKGKIIILNIWVTWSEECTVELPLLEKFYNNINDKNFLIIAVNSSETKYTVKKFVAENELSFEVLIDKYNTVMSSYSSGVIPTSYIIDRRGYVIARYMGSYKWNDEKILEIFNDLLDENVKP